MNIVLKTRIVKIGNAQGIRIPKPFLKHINVDDQVELEWLPGQIIIRPAHRARIGGEAAFQSMAERGDAQMLDSDAYTTTPRAESRERDSR